MATRIVSFGFKYGPPVDAELVLDVRFLENPYFVPELKPLTGLDLPVAKYVMELPETVEFMKKTRELLAYVMPKYEREGKSYFTIAVGCTGGASIVPRCRARRGARAPRFAASAHAPNLGARAPRRRSPERAFVERGRQPRGASDAARAMRDRSLHHREQARAPRTRGDEARPARGAISLRC